jgi:hypothetical protein
MDPHAHRPDRSRRSTLLRRHFACAAALLCASPAPAIAHPFQYVDRNGQIHQIATEPGDDGQSDASDGKPPFDATVQKAASLQGIPAALIHAVIRVESGYDPGAISSAGAIGLMQLMPATASALGVAHPFDPVENIMGGARFLRILMDSFDGDLARALAAYHAGPRAVRRAGGVAPTTTTRDYVLAVLRGCRGVSH